MVDIMSESTGPWHVALLALIGCNYAIVAVNHALPAFHGYTPPYHCQNNGLSNSTAKPVEGCLLNNQECSAGYLFESARNDRTIVTEWELVCDRKQLRPLVATLYFCGVTLGALAGGLAADRYGRKPVMLASLYLQGVLGVALYATYSLEAFIAVRILQGFFIQCLQGSTYTLLIELFPLSARTAVGVVLEIFWAVGLTVLTAASFLLPNWRYLQLALSVPTALTLFYVCFVPESARWLSTQGRNQEASEVLQQIRRLNDRFTSEPPNNGIPTFNLESTKSDYDLNQSCIYHSNNHLQVIDNCNIISAIQEKRGSASKDDKLYRPTRLSTQEVSLRISKDSISESDENILAITPEIKENYSASLDSPQAPLATSESKLSGFDGSAVSVVGKLDKIDANGEMPLKETIVMNGKGHSSHTELANSPSSHGLLDLFTSTALRKINVIMIFIWFSVSLSYYGIMFYLPDLSGDRHLNFVLGAVLEVTSYGLAYLVLSKYGRRLPLVAYLILSGALCASVSAVGLAQGANSNDSLAILQTALALLGKAAVVSAFCTIFIYTSELFPTVVRAAAMGHCGFWGRVGSLLAPQLLLLGEYTSKVVPLLCMSILVIIAGLLAFALPETFECPLADTIQQVEDTHKLRKQNGNPATK